MNITIRPAMPDDAPAIAAISRLSLDTDMDESNIRSLLMLHRGFTRVAVLSGRVAGFADYFLTLSRADEIRLELDLLAVHPTAQGRGAGRQLVHAGIEQAKGLRVSSLRALVAADNHAMRRLCAGLGFACSDDSFDLFAAAAPFPSSRRQHHARVSCLIPVETLSYAGIWIEGAASLPAIDSAFAIASARKLNTVGAVVSRCDAAAQSLFRANHFDCLGAYDWWTLKV